MESVGFPCPQCGGRVRINQVQGDRCGGCGFEFKWFTSTESHSALDYHEALSGVKHLLVLSRGRGTVVAHE